MTRACWLLWLLLLSSVAHAQQTDDERARMHFQSGLSYYEQARYDDAAREFREAYNLSQRPALLLNLSQAYERDLKFAEAITELQRYLEVVPDSAQRRTVETRITRLQELQARMESSATRPAEVPAATDTATSTTTPTPTTTATSEPEPAPAPAAASVTPPASRAGVSVPGLVLAGAGGLMLAGSLVTGLIAHGAHNDLEERCPGDVCPASENAQPDIDSGKTMAWLSTGLFAGGLVAAAVGTVLILTSGAEQESAPVSAQVTIAPGRLAGIARFTF